MLNDLVLLEERIHQLPPNLIGEVNDFISNLLKQHSISNDKNYSPEMITAKQFLKELRPHCVVGDVISPIEEQWNATL